MPENRYALLIASFDYADPYFRRLEAPAHDVEALSRVLHHEAMGNFRDVKTLLNKPRDELVLAIEEFFADRSTEDLLLLYFSGHGIKDADGRLYYATKNTLHNRLVSTAVPAYQVNDLIARSMSRRKILVLDCCYSGAFSKAFLTKGDAAVGVMEEFRQGKGLVTLTGSDAFQYSFEEPAERGAICSVFTHALVEGIETGKADEDGDQFISLDELYHYAYERVRTENPRQSPHRSGDVEGNIIVARNPRPPRPAQLPPKVQEAIESPIPEVREGIIQVLKSFLLGRNKGLALAAREALQLLTEDDSRRVASAAQKCIDAFGEVGQLGEKDKSGVNIGEGAGTGGPADEKAIPAQPIVEAPETQGQTGERETEATAAGFPSNVEEPQPPQVFSVGVTLFLLLFVAIAVLVIVLANRKPDNKISTQPSGGQQVATTPVTSEKAATTPVTSEKVATTPVTSEKAATTPAARCASGDAKTCYDLGVLYDNRKGVPRDKVRAMQFYQQACTGGYASACDNLGVMYSGEMDDVRAEQLYEQACRGGSASGCANLGGVYEHGIGVHRDRVLAAHFYEQACKGGDAQGCTNFERLSTVLQGRQ